MWIALKIVRAHPKVLNNPFVNWKIFFIIYIALSSKQLTLKR